MEIIMFDKLTFIKRLFRIYINVTYFRLVNILLKGYIYISYNLHKPMIYFSKTLKMVTFLAAHNKKTRFS